MRHPPRLVEAVEHHLRQLANVDDARHPLPQRRERLHEVEPFGEEDGEDFLFHLGLQRLEEDEDDERRHHRVEEEQAGGAGPTRQHAVDQGQHHADAGEEHDLSQQLVEIEQAVPLDGLGKEVQVDRHCHVRERRRRPSGKPDEELAERQSDAEGSADPEIEEARPLGARRGPAHPGIQEAHGRRELDEDRSRCRDPRRRHQGQRRDGNRHRGQRRRGGEAAETHDASGGFPLKFNDKGEHRDRDEPRGCEGHPQRPRLRQAEDTVEEVADLVREQREIEQREGGPQARPALAQEHGQSERQTDDGGKQRALGAGIHRDGG